MYHPIFLHFPLSFESKTRGLFFIILKTCIANILMKKLEYNKKKSRSFFLVFCLSRQGVIQTKDRANDQLIAINKLILWKRIFSVSKHNAVRFKYVKILMVFYFWAC